MYVLGQEAPLGLCLLQGCHTFYCMSVCDHTTQDKARKVKRGPPTTASLVFASPPHFRPVPGSFCPQRQESRLW